jgi:hypothetical protein
LAPLSPSSGSSLVTVACLIGVLVSVLAAFIRPARWQSDCVLVLGVVAAFILLVDVGMNLYVLRHPVGADGVALIVMILMVACSAVNACRPSEISWVQRMRSVTWHVLVLASMGGAIGVGLTSRLDMWRAQKWIQLQDRVRMPETMRAHTVTVVAFVDYECPFCQVHYRDYDPVILDLRSASPDLVEFDVHDFPLDATCNPAVKTTIHHGACLAATVVRFAARHQKTAQVRDFLYDHQAELSIGAIEDYVGSLGWRAEFELARAELLRETEADAVLGAMLGVSGTPTYFVDGISVTGWSPATLALIIRASASRLPVANKSRYDR